MSEALLVGDHRSTHRHRSVCTAGAIPEYGQSVQPHSPFGPCLIPSASHPFGTLKDVCKGTVTWNMRHCRLRYAGGCRSKRATVTGQKYYAHVLCEWNRAVDKAGEQFFNEML
jgi:hypothetical protein